MLSEWKGAWHPECDLGILEADLGRSTRWAPACICQSTRALPPRESLCSWQGCNLEGAMWPPSSTLLTGGLLPWGVGIHAWHVAVQALGAPTLEKVANPVFSLAGRDLEGVPGLGQLALVGKGCCLEGYGSVDQYQSHTYKWKRWA